jgi:phosphoribosylamine---glycine ligase
VRVLCIDRAGDGLLDTAIRAIASGHQLRYFLRDYDREKRPLGKGLVELVDDWRPWIRWCDLCLLSSNDLYMTELDRWRAEGVPIIGGGVESASWEHDRAKGMAVFKRAGIPVPAYREFTDYDTASAYVRRKGTPFASKPCGNCDDKSLSYVAKTADDLLYMLERWKKVGKRQGVEFILQEKVEGIEMAVGAWYGPGGFVPGWEENFEFKKMCSGDVGPNTGEMGTVIRLVKRSRLAEKVLAPLDEHLSRIGFVGNVDVNCIIDQDGTPWPLEFTTRFGWPAWNIETTLYDHDPIEFLAGVANGDTNLDRVRRLNEVAVGVYLRFLDGRGIIGAPIYGLGESLGCEHRAVELFVGGSPNDPRGGVNPDDMLCSAGDHPILCVGTGVTVREAARKAYKALGEIHIPGSPLHRNDIGKRLSKELPKLQSHGFASGMEY